MPENLAASPISRVTRSKAEARANYNRLSRWYDALAGSSEKKYRQLGLQALAVQPGESVLEIGYGTGQALLALAQAVGPTGKVTGIDLSDGMCAQAQHCLTAAGLAGRVELLVGDAAQLPWATDSFDAVFMSFTLELFDTPEIPQVLQHCLRVLRPGGRLALVTMTKSEKPALAECIYEWFHARMPAAVDCRPIFAQAALRQAGFEVRSARALRMWGLPVEIILAGAPARGGS
ncbi:MAG: methyltransferase domain-containing protein [Chloroflexota bacterium]